MADSDLLTQGINELTQYNGVATDSLPTQNLGKDEFLQLLITQLQYQDPMEPMDDNEYIAQLAQFSELEQMTNMNDNLTENLNWNFLLSQTINNTMATSLLGKDIKAIGNDAYLPADGNAQLHYNLGGFADTVVIDVYDGSGEKVASYTQNQLGAGDQLFEWDGRTMSGDTASTGTYSFTITATDADGNTVTASPYMSGTVDGVQYVDGQAYLVVDGNKISLGDVMEVGTGVDDG